jgi:putative GTP pyrophosphokinase
MAGKSETLGELRARYAQVYPEYDALTRKISDLVTELVAGERVLSVSGRTKDEESFIAKALRRNEDGKFRYSDPLTEITDISGVRVICYTVSQAKSVCEIVTNNFDVVEYVDKSEELREKRKLGYTSIHLLSKLNNERSNLPEYKRHKDLLCEIQVRTILQHAWAELEHRVQYKKGNIDNKLHERFLALAGLIQIADREFEGIVELNNLIEAKISADLQTSDPSAVEESEDSRGKRPNLAKAGAGGRKLHSIKYMFGVGPAELVQMGEYEKADIVYSEFIAVQPNQPSHFEGRAKARALLGRLEEAKADLREALRLHPGEDRLKIALQRLGQLSS